MLGTNKDEKATLIPTIAMYKNTGMSKLVKLCFSPLTQQNFITNKEKADTVIKPIIFVEAKGIAIISKDINIRMKLSRFLTSLLD